MTADFQKIDLNSSSETKLDLTKSSAVSDPPLAALPKAGYKLARFILFIIVFFIAFLLVYILFHDVDGSNKIDFNSKLVISDSTNFEHQKELIKYYQEEKKNYRDFIIQISQMVLLNLLLPTLTAILGYIFGSREEAKRNEEKI